MASWPVGVQTTYCHLPCEIKKIIFDLSLLLDINETGGPNVGYPWEAWIFDIYDLLWNVTDRTLLGLLQKNLPGPVRVKCLSLTYPVIQTPGGIDFATKLISLTLSGYLVVHNLIPLFEECLNLRHLEFDKVTNCPELYRHEVNQNDPTKLLPSLRKLIINFPDFHTFCASSSLFEEKKKSDQFMRMLRLLDPFWGCGVSKSKLTDVEFRYEYLANLPNLEYQILGDNYTPVNLVAYHHGVDEFLRTLARDNQDTLTTVKLRIKRSKSTVIKLYPKLNRHLNTSIEEFFYSNAEDQNDTLWKLFLKSDWLQCLNKQTHLKRFVLTGNLVPNFPASVLIFSIANNNSSTLENLSLTVQRNRFNRFDAKTFSGLRVLEEFALLSRFNKCDLGDSGKNWQGLINIQCLPSTIRILKLSVSIMLGQPSDFCQETFENLTNVEVFEFSAHPWILYRRSFSLSPMTSVNYMDESKITNIIQWLPKLRIFNLRNRINIQASKSEDSNSVPDTSIDWIKEKPHIAFDKIYLREDDDFNFFLRNNPDPDYIVNIRIDPPYRAAAFIVPRIHRY